MGRQARLSTFPQPWASSDWKPAWVKAAPAQDALRTVAWLSEQNRTACFFHLLQWKKAKNKCQITSQSLCFAKSQPWQVLSAICAVLRVTHTHTHVYVCLCTWFYSIPSSPLRTVLSTTQMCKNNHPSATTWEAMAQRREALQLRVQVAEPRLHQLPCLLLNQVHV